MRKHWLLIIIMIAVAGCSSSPSDADIAAAIAETAQAQPLPTNTLIPSTDVPTKTPVPTDTPKPVPTDTTAPCSIQSSSYLLALEEMIERWDDAVDLANSTSRISLAGPISDLQEIKQEANALEYPECAKRVSGQLALYMERTIDSILSFAASGSDDEVIAYTAQSKFMLHLFDDYMDSLNTGGSHLDRYFLYAYGPDQELRITYGFGLRDSDSFVTSEPWIQEVPADSEYPINLAVTRYSGSPFINHICFIYREAELLAINMGSSTEKAECVFDAP